MTGRSQSTRVRLMRKLVLGMGIWGATAMSQAQSIEAPQDAFRLANQLTNTINDAFASGDLRRGYADAITALNAFAKVQRDQDAWDILSQMVASQAAGLGMHDLALEVMGPTGQIAAVPQGLEAQPAIQEIVQAAAGHRIVMLNEAHHVGLHREFARRMLKPLRAAGFTHLACEGFANARDEGFEIDAQRLGYATRDTGHYISDPFFADFVREAVELGFKLVAYETLDRRPPGEESPAASINRRETSQAEQLEAVLDADPNARLFVYCGYSHLTESPMRVDGEEVRWLASRLREATGIDPLTVSQTTYYPRSSNRQRGSAIAGFDRDDSFVLRDDDGLWSPKPEQYDIELLHPSTDPVDGRPGWMFRADDRERVDVDLSAIDQSDDAVLVVTREGEPMNAIPSDVVLLRSGQREAALSLRAGSYHVWLVRQDHEPELIASPIVN
ncbi:MAG: hypothetical protein R3B67_03030 [Phycisphaerales bacterium]